MGATRGIVIAMLVVFTAAVAAAIVIAVSGGGTHPTGTRASSVTTSASSVSSTPTTSATATSTPRPTTAVTAAGVTAAEVESVVNAYVAAYNSRQPHALRALFSPSLVRRTGPGRPQNLARAMRVYRGQLGSEPNPDFVLSNVHVTTTPTGGRATADYAVTILGQRQQGTITFGLTPHGNGLLVDEIVISSHP